MELNTTKLSQSGSRKLTPHDNCTVLDLDILGVGASVYPRVIEIRIPGIDGARQSALWDGSLDLEVNDVIIADEYAGQTIWRVSGMGGDDSGAGKVRVNKVWASDFTSESLVTDASDNVTINTGTLTIPSDMIHGGDPDTKWSFAVDDVEITVGSVSMLKLTEAGQDLITLGPGSGDIDINFNGDMFLRGSDGFFGIGTASPITFLEVKKDQNTITQLRITNNNDHASAVTSCVMGTTIGATANQGFALNVYPDSSTATGPGSMALAGWAQFRSDSQLNGYVFNVSKSTGGMVFATGNIQAMRIHDTQQEIMIGAGTSLPGAKLYVDQQSTVAAIPVLTLDQADVSEEMIEFVTTIGTGNAIEVSGLKLLTTTHFVKTTLPGGLTKYFPVGDINTTGPTHTKSTTVTTQGLGANPDIFAFGFYEWSVTDIHLSHVSLTQTFGTANISYAAHAFVVTAANGTVNTGVVGLRVNGTSINDQGTRTTSDTETIIADITAAGTNGYHESSKKWLGQVTFELFTVSGSPTVIGLDINYGLAKYDDWFNNDFTITDVEAIGFAGANDSNFDVKLMHHQTSGWIYHATAFTPITAANTIASLATDHSTDDQLLSSQHAAWKRDNLSTAIDGSGSEGFLIFISSSANNAVEYFNLHIGVVF